MSKLRIDLNIQCYRRLPRLVLGVSDRPSVNIVVRMERGAEGQIISESTLSSPYDQAPDQSTVMALPEYYGRKNIVLWRMQVN